MKGLNNILKLLFFIVFFSFGAHAQKYFTKTGEISFFSKTPIENIEATSNTATTVFDIATGQIQWAVLIKSFEFEKALMQEHFNENYMESTQFPKATFKGKIVSLDQLNLNEDGTYTVDISGKLTIHGVTQDITSPAVFKVEQGSISASTILKVLVADYGIDIPAVVRENIAKEIEVDIKANYEKLDKS